MSDDAIEFVLKAVKMVAEHGWKLLPQVNFPTTRYVNSQIFKSHQDAPVYLFVKEKKARMAEFG